MSIIGGHPTNRGCGSLLFWKKGGREVDGRCVRWRCVFVACMPECWGVRAVCLNPHKCGEVPLPAASRGLLFCGGQVHGVSSQHVPFRKRVYMQLGCGRQCMEENVTV